MNKNKFFTVFALCILLISAGCVEQNGSIEPISENTTNKTTVNLYLNNETVEKFGYKEYNNNSEINAQDSVDIQIYEKKTNHNLNISDYTVRDLVFGYNITIEKYTNISQVAEKDPTLTKDSIRKVIREDNITLIDVIEGSDVKLNELISKEQLVNNINNNINKEIEPGIDFSLYSHTASQKIEIFDEKFSFIDGLETSISIPVYFDSKDFDIEIEDTELSSGSYELQNKTYNYSIYRVYVYNESEISVGRLIRSEIDKDNYAVKKTGIYPISSDEKQNIIEMMKKTQRKK